MTETLILHHYDTSPFSEKVRVALGVKGLAWSSVHVPNTMPKPDVISLTGGYRRTPIAQIGADGARPRAPAGSARGGLGKRPWAFSPHDVSCGAVC